jgi:hypothetical protein
MNTIDIHVGPQEFVRVLLLDFVASRRRIMVDKSQYTQGYGVVEQR